MRGRQWLTHTYAPPRHSNVHYGILSCLPPPTPTPPGAPPPPPPPAPLVQLVQAVLEALRVVGVLLALGRQHVLVQLDELQEGLGGGVVEAPLALAELERHLCVAGVGGRWGWGWRCRGRWSSGPRQGGEEGAGRGPTLAAAARGMQVGGGVGAGRRGHTRIEHPCRSAPRPTSQPAPARTLLTSWNE